MVRAGNHSYSNGGHFVVQGAIKCRKDNFNWTDYNRRDRVASERRNTVIAKKPPPTMANTKRKEYLTPASLTRSTES